MESKNKNIFSVINDMFCKNREKRILAVRKIKEVITGLNIYEEKE